MYYNPIRMNLDRLRETALHRCLLDANRPVLVGVSGGADSLCLMASFALLGFPVIVAHFDHHLRADSAADAAVVEREALRLGLRFVLGGADVAAYAVQEHLSVEAAARALRYRFLFAQASALGAQAVAVGHTADDQVETVLLHLLRGSGLNGLTGMEYRRLMTEWDREIPLVRPLLDFWRADTVACCEALDLKPVTDVTNADTAYARNRIRHQLIPMLETYNPQARQALWRMARTLAGDAEVVRAAVDAAWDRCLHSFGPGFAQLLLQDLRDQPEGAQRGVIRRAAAAVAPLPDGLDYEAVERALALVREPSAGVQVDLNSDLRAWIESGMLVLASKDAVLPVEDYPQMSEDCDAVEVPVPGNAHLPGGWVITARVEDAPHHITGSDWSAWLDADMVHSPLLLRCAYPGERFQPFGMHERSIKLSDFWTNEKLPRRLRARWPLLLCGGTVVWVPGYRLAHPFRVQENTRRAVVLHLHRVG